MTDRKDDYYQPWLRDPAPKPGAAAPEVTVLTLRSQPLSAAEQAAFAASVAESLQQQQAMEAEPQGDFDAFVAAYQASILALAV